MYLDCERSLILLLLCVSTFKYSSSVDDDTSKSSIISNGDCLSPAALNLFKFSPGGYEVTDGSDMKSSECSNLCSPFEYKYSGVILQSYCLCASERDIKENSHLVEKIDSQSCSKGSNGILVSLTENRSLQSIKLIVSPERTFIDEAISLDITLPSKGDTYEVLVDFDDGSSLSGWSDKRKFDHTYRIPGQFTIKVHARSTKSPDKLIAASMVNVLVGSKLDDNEISLNCHTLIEPGDNPMCNVTLYSGQDMTIEMNFSNSTESVQAFNVTGEFVLLLSLSLSLLVSC